MNSKWHAAQLFVSAFVIADNHNPPLNKYKSTENNRWARCSVTFWNITLAITFRSRSFPPRTPEHESNGCISRLREHSAVSFCNVSNSEYDRISMSVSLDRGAARGSNDKNCCRCCGNKSTFHTPPPHDTADGTAGHLICTGLKLKQKHISC